ncbi:hypothetical protein V202x_42560 [Gimesia aquarii]|uniref:Uncharacterized protein n=1 Tax=Gimesia aquarii TaxID=2527964 RepID=A0A517X014_9PLAN|nr:hypothetical protein V202x_42560 [Gimesia aquarii]
MYSLVVTRSNRPMCRLREFWTSDFQRRIPEAITVIMVEHYFQFINIHFSHDWMITSTVCISRTNQRRSRPLTGYYYICR